MKSAQNSTKIKADDGTLLKGINFYWGWALNDPGGTASKLG